MNRLLAVLALLLLTSCAATVEDYVDSKPALSLKSFFTGDVSAYGLFQDHSGQVVRSFTVKLHGEWQGATGTLHEEFVFDDGERQTRDWTLTDLGNGKFRGTAADVVGEAEGIAVGRALRWRYTLQVPVDGDTYQFEFDDWLWQFDDKRMFNKARMKKFGFTVGEITLFFEKAN